MSTLSRPKGCKSTITLDYDMDYDIFAECIYKWLRRRAEKLGAYLACWRSTNNKIHCSLCIDKELEEVERLAYETFFLDDPVRILFNLQRLVLLGRMHDRLFAYKMKLRMSED